MDVLAVALAVLNLGAPLELPFESTVVVTGREASCGFAVKELNEIVKKATGRGFKAKGEGEQRTVHRIFIGRSEEAEKILGKETFDSLGEEESLVVAKGNDLFLAGGDELGTLWSVYDFVEDNLDYRWYLPWPECEKVAKLDRVVYRGKGSRRQPEFRGGRDMPDRPHMRKVPLHRTWAVRQRCTQAVAGEFPGTPALFPGWTYKYMHYIPGHGYDFYLPRGKRPDWWKVLYPPALEWEVFAKHPEYYSLDEHGKRSDRMQLCFSNPKTVDALYGGLLVWVKEHGRGVYQIGVNDDHGGTFCFCPECLAADKRRKCGGGAMWEAIVDICHRLKRDGYEGVYVTALAYRGQTETYPEGLEFPDNFIVDSATSNHSHSLREYDVVTGGRFFDNAATWGRHCRHGHAWYYCETFLSTVERMQKELLEYREIGVDSVYACGGCGGDHAFGWVNSYFFLRLLSRPDLDLKAEKEKVYRDLYGAAWKSVLKFSEILERTRQKYVPTVKRIDGYGYLTGVDIAHLHRRFAEDAEKVKGTVEGELHSYVRMYVDLFAVLFCDRVKRDAPDYAYSVAESRARAVKTAAEFTEKRVVPLRGKKQNPLERQLSEMANYVNLKTDKLPPELAKYPATKVTRILPAESRKHEWWWFAQRPTDPCNYMTSERDDTAVCGWAMAGDVPAGVTFDEKHPPEFNFYEHGAGRYLRDHVRVPMDFFERGKYKLFCLGMSKIRPTALMEFGTFGSRTHAILTKTLQRCADPIYLDKEFEIWASVKAEGPMFFKEDAGRKNRLYVEQFFVVDK